MAKIWINEKRIIVSGNSDWDNLALYNNAPYLGYERITGTSYLSYIRGDAVRMLIDTIISRVNVTEKPYLIHYRCDNSNTAQFMSMLVKKESVNELSIEHTLNKREKIYPSISFTENANAQEERCWVCGRVHFKDQWYDAFTQRKAFGTLQSLETKSSVCPDCSSNFEIDNIVLRNPG